GSIAEIYRWRNRAKQKARKAGHKTSRPFAPLRKLIANDLRCLGRRLRARFPFHRPEDQVAKAPPVNEYAAIGAPIILDAASRDNRGAEHKRVDETADDHGNFREEQRVIVFLNAKIRPEHLVVLPADHA